jgi:hypothetical protein
MLHRNMTPSSDETPQSSLSAPMNHLADHHLSAPSQVFRSKVYRANEGDDWIVEPPRNMVSVVDKAVFTGPRAQHLALTYAYETFGNARFFPY